MTRSPLAVVLLLFVLSLSSCDFVGDVIEFSFWTMLIIVVLLVALVVWIFKKLF